MKSIIKLVTTALNYLLCSDLAHPIVDHQQTPSALPHRFSLDLEALVTNTNELVSYAAELYPEALTEQTAVTKKQSSDLAEAARCLNDDEASRVCTAPLIREQVFQLRMSRQELLWAFLRSRSAV